MAKQTLTPDLCVIGAGAAGLSVAAGAAQLGLDVVLFEAGEMGGDCLNTGCVPSKALIKAANTRHAMTAADRFGIRPVAAPGVDWLKLQAHIKGVIATIAPVDSQERFEGFGVTVIRQWARFASPDSVESDGHVIKAKRFVVAAGATAFIPPIPGLKDTPFETNETIFDMATLPASLIVLGGGVIGVELGQAFARLGVAVTIVEGATLMGRSDPEAVALLRQSLLGDGITLIEGAMAKAVAGDAGDIRITLDSGAIIAGERLLVAVGRKARTDDMGLDAAGVDTNRAGIITDTKLRSVSNRKVWALGDIAGREQLTHAGGYHASLWIKTVLFKAPGSAEVPYMPAVAYTTPEVAQIGLTEADAKDKHGHDVSVSRWSLDDNDRAIAERDTTGFAKLIIGKGGKLLGATVVGEAAGETIQVIAMAMANGLGVRSLTNLISPYPTRSEVAKRAASAYFTPTLFSDRTRLLVKVLKRFG